MRNIYFFSILTVIVGTSLTSCKTSMSSVSMQVLKPAPISVPRHIQKVAVVNRSRASEENKTMNMFEGIITGEGIYADREGAEECLAGLRQTLTRTDRFTVAQPAGLDLRGTGTGMMATPLSWEQVEKICKDNSVDAIIALESFDSDSRVTMSAAPVQTRDPKGNPITVTEHRAAMRMDVKTAWRIYDPQNKSIVDEFKSLDDMGFNANGPTPEAARLALPIKRDAVKKTGYFAGQQYGNRISPSWVSVSRAYYTKYNDNFKLAAKKVRYKDWDGAAEIWKKEALGADKQAAGMACYNMAVAAEVQGNLDAAVEWANKAYKDFENFKALSYKQTLEQRIYDVKRLEQQLNKEGQ